MTCCYTDQFFIWILPLTVFINFKHKLPPSYTRYLYGLLITTFNLASVNIKLSDFRDFRKFLFCFLLVKIFLDDPPPTFKNDATFLRTSQLRTISNCLRMNCHYNKIITIIIQDTGMSFLTGNFTGSCIELNNCICNLYKLSELTRHFVEQHHLKYISYRCRYIFTGSNTMLDL